MAGGLEHPESLYRAASAAAEEYRNEMILRLGRDHGAEAIAEWNRQRFWLWAVDRVVEHALGEHCWLECGLRNFSRAAQKRQELGGAIEELQRLQRKLAGESLPGFQEKERLSRRIAELANRLLD